MGRSAIAVPVAYQSFSVLLAIVFAVILLVLLVGLLAALVRYRRTRHRKMAILAISLGLALATVSGVVAYAAWQSYVAQSTWRFDYYVALQGNASAVVSVVVPVPHDEELLAGLHVTAGVANWSFVDTAIGRGLFVRMTGSAAIETSVSLFPAPAVPPDTTSTLMSTGNCTPVPSNCTGLPSMWIFYSGPAGIWIGFHTSSWWVSDSLKGGWVTYVAAPPPVPET